MRVRLIDLGTDGVAGLPAGDTVLVAVVPRETISGMVALGLD